MTSALALGRKSLFLLSTFSKGRSWLPPSPDAVSVPRLLHLPLCRGRVPLVLQLHMTLGLSMSLRGGGLMPSSPA